MKTYEIWIDHAEGKESFLYSFTDAIGLSDADAKTKAVSRLQDIINKINTPAPDTIIVKAGVVHPPAHTIRVNRQEEELE